MVDKSNVCLCGCFQPAVKMFVNNHHRPMAGRTHSKETIKKMLEHNGRPQLPLGSKRKCNGYMLIKTLEGWKPEHRVVMEKKLGRKLASNEIPHHKNENKTDNRRKNLRLMTDSKHKSMHKRRWFKKKEYFS